jgi:hypothetical protein
MLAWSFGYYLCDLCFEGFESYGKLQRLTRPVEVREFSSVDIVFFGWSEIQVWEHHIDLIAAASGLCSGMGLLLL